jgi:uncharacterized membrane protein YdjX (TVP38/TMEM64 family)
MKYFKLKKIKKHIPLIILASTGFMIWQTGIYQHISLNSLKENQLFLIEYVSSNLLFSAFLYSALYFIIVSLSIPAATIMTLVGGFLFGQIIGTICVVLSASLGGCSIFLSTKLASKNSAKKEHGTWVQKMKSGFSENAFSYMLTLRLIPIFPFVIVNIVAGVLQIPLKTFFFGTLIGIIPGSYIYTSVGVAMQTLLNEENFTPESLLSPDIIIALTGLGALALLPIIYRIYKKRSKKR